MLLVDALTLCPGDRIDWAGDARETRKWTGRGAGTVIGVTDGGGILIEVDQRRGGGRHMVGYHMVREWHRSAARGSRPGRLTSAADARVRGKVYRLPGGGREALDLLAAVAFQCGHDVARAILRRTGLGHVRDMRQADAVVIAAGCRCALAAVLSRDLDRECARLGLEIMA
jgi:hypothetical protein